MNCWLHPAVLRDQAVRTLPRRELIKGILAAGPLAVLGPRLCRAAGNADDVRFEPERNIIPAPGELRRKDVADVAGAGPLRHDRLSLRDGSEMRMHPRLWL